MKKIIAIAACVLTSSMLSGCFEGSKTESALDDDGVPKNFDMNGRLGVMPGFEWKGTVRILTINGEEMDVQAFIQRFCRSKDGRSLVKSNETCKALFMNEASRDRLKPTAFN